MDRHVFISYRRSDGAFVDELIAVLNGYTCWRDTTGIAGGQVWREEIIRAIEAAYAMILVVSADTEQSKEVYAEYFYAFGHKVPIIPLLISEGELPFGLENINARLWYEDKPRAVEELRGDLERYRAQAASLKPASDLRTYLGAMQLGYLMAVGNYTPMAGEGRFRRERVARSLHAVVMRPEFSLRRAGPLFGERQTIQEKREYENLLPALRESKRVMVLGEPGIGKTTTLFKFSDELRQQALERDGAPIPLIVPLREWRGDLTWDGLIDRHLGALAPRYGDLLTSRRLYFLLDGLNELPRDDRRGAKLDAIRRLLGPETPAVVTCRELDYRDEALNLDLDTIAIHPLDPERVRDFLRRYLIDARGEMDGLAAAEELFWQIAGGADVKAVWEKWRRAGIALNQFFSAAEIPAKVWGNVSDDQLWQRVIKSPGSLMHLAANPYLLWMILNIYLEVGTIPSNRGALFDEFVFQLLKREGLAEDDKLSARLEDLAWVMQSRAVKSGERRGGVELTIPRSEAISVLDGEERLYRAASANLLEDAEPVRFTHQLMQEYFTGRNMVAEIGAGRLAARDLWPKERWWEPSGWEEAAVLAVGLSGKDAEKIVDWLQEANPEVAAMAMQRSGAEFKDRFKETFRDEWLARMTDLKRCPEALARAANGRALSSVTLQNGEPLDNRHGVGLTSDGLPDIDWVPISGGTVRLEDVKGEFEVKPFRIARYLVTNRQFQAFVDAPDGYGNKQWWKDLVQSPAPSSPRWTEANHPRETVSWYEAVAFCRWLTEKSRERGLLGKNQEIRLPTEWEWQQAATNGNPDNVYPWGVEWDASCCNGDETGLRRTSAVGVYPHGTWQDGPLDMMGNLWEWCLNKYDNPTGLNATRVDKSGQRVFRGGSWDNDPVYLRSSTRYRDSAVYWDFSIGFRLAQDSK
jgi:hypothetical protein